MIPHGVEIFVGLQPIDLRWGFDRLAGIVEERIGRKPRSGALFVFFGKRRDALKVLFYDGTGLCLFYSACRKAGFAGGRRHRTPRRASRRTSSRCSCAAETRPRLAPRPSGAKWPAESEVARPHQSRASGRSAALRTSAEGGSLRHGGLCSDVRP